MSRRLMFPGEFGELFHLISNRNFSLYSEKKKRKEKIRKRKKERNNSESCRYWGLR